jgi:hypothetical protein
MAILTSQHSFFKLESNFDKYAPNSQKFCVAGYQQVTSVMLSLLLSSATVHEYLLL